MGIIYKIEIGEDLYIGSTKQKLNQRQTKHNQGLNNPNDKNYNGYLYKFCREKKIEKIICELLETVEDTELVLLEQEYITMLEPSLNIRRAFQTEEERIEQIRLHCKKKSKCPECGLEMNKKSIKTHIRNIH